MVVAIASVAVVGGLVIISNYVMLQIHQFCQNKLGALKSSIMKSFDSGNDISSHVAVGAPPIGND